MLTQKIRARYREFIEPAVKAKPMKSVNTVRSASNASDFSSSGMKARRQRRQRRIERAAGHKLHGWAVRTW
jgi:hypothetical protein